MDLFGTFQKSESEINFNDREESEIMCKFLTQLKKLINFINDTDEINYKYHIYQYFDILNSNIDNLIIIIPVGFQLISDFDYKDVRFNGYRSIFRIVKKCISQVYFNLKRISSSFLFKKKYEIQCEDYIKCLLQLTVIVNKMFQIMMFQKNKKHLFLQQNENNDLYCSITSSFESMQNEAFYGHCLGFYLNESCQVLAKIFCSVQLGMGQALSTQETKTNFDLFLTTLVRSTKSLLMERKRGIQFSNLLKQSTIFFCKQFWNLVDHPMIISSSNLVLPYLKVINKIVLPAVPLFCPSLHNPCQNIQFLPPVKQNGFTEVTIRLLSKICRVGMQDICNRAWNEKLANRSSYLLIHCHGGGFVAQSSQSHDVYLRRWAFDLDCPIVSIDYSHAPEYPFPRAHEECLYAYAWVLQNLNELGCLPNCKIIICGDSAGGNLALSCVLKLLELHVRVPDGIFLCYPSTLVGLELSPSRMMGTFCPILPLGILARCLFAYVGIDEEDIIKSLDQNFLSRSQDTANEKPNQKSNSKKKFLEHGIFNEIGARIFYSKNEAIFPISLAQRIQLPSNAMLSPLMAEEELLKNLPPLSIIGAEFDPLLDDSVEFCKKVDKAGGKSVHLQVLKDLPHGFLNMATPMTKGCLNGMRQCVDEIKRLFQIC